MTRPMHTGDDERDLFEPLRPAHGTKLVLASWGRHREERHFEREGRRRADRA